MKKSFILTILLCLTFASAGWAQSYNSLWKQAAQAQNDDLPRTALEIVTKIQQKAEREGNTSQLIRALCSRVMLGDDIAPDSTTTEIARMTARRDAETRPVERALWNMALAKSMEQFRNWRDTSYNEKIAHCYTEMFCDMSALSRAKTADYLPLFVKGKHSSYFKHDVLHVLAGNFLNERMAVTNTSRDNMEMLARLVAHYRSLGNREAVLLWTLDSLKRGRSRTYNLAGNKQFQRLQSLAKEYRDMKLNVLTYVAMTELGYSSRANDSLLSLVAEEGIRLYPRAPHTDELRNYLIRVRQPELRIVGIPSVMYPAHDYEAHLLFKAKNRCEMRLYRINGHTARTLSESNVSANKLPVTLVRSYSYSVAEQPPYVASDTVVRFVAPDEPGLYIMRLYDGKEEFGNYFFNCTRMKYMLLAMEGGKNRVTIVDALSGAPILGTTMELCSKPHNRNGYIVENFSPDADGNYLIDVTNRQNRMAYITLGADCGLPGFSLESHSQYNRNKAARTTTRLYTDRGIYRPGQKVIVGGFVFTQQDDSLHVEGEKALTISLYDSNQKNVATQRVFTNDLGNFGCEFDLPKTVLPGLFRVEAKGIGTPSMHHIDVQEYKRPTFTVELDPITRTYQPGDTLMLTGTARTYSGLPVESATVSYETERYELLYWYRRGVEEPFKLQLGDTITDAEGRFCIPIVLKTAENRDCLSFFHTNIDVTAQHGETQSASQNTYVSHRRAHLSIKWPETICFEHIPAVTPLLLNTQSNNVPAAGTMTVKLGNRIVLTDSIRTGEPIRLTRNQLPESGKYTIEIVVESEGETYQDSSKVRFFSELDTRPSAGDDFWYNVRQSAQNDTAHVIIGSAQHDVTMFYDVYIKNKLIESRRIVFSDSLLHYTLAWKPEFGDAANVCFAFVKNNKLYSHTVSLVKPEPDKRLKMGWVTFRSLLTPGQQEEWRLRVTTPDGRPARAALMARLYDASLDALRPYKWTFAHNFHRDIPYSHWREKLYPFGSVSGNYPLNLLEIKELSFTRITPQLFRMLQDADFASETMMVGYGMYRKSERAPMMMARSAMDYSETTAVFESVEEDEIVANGLDAENEAENVAPRTNFNETAFFYPTLRTEENGEVSIAFTLPESLTQWNFHALAHTADMRYALLDTMAVARKEFMVEPAMPRFVREGDKAQIPVTVRNITNKSMDGTLLLQVLDSETEKVLFKQTLKFAAPANGMQVQTFAIDADELVGLGVVTVRVTGKSGLYGDGEEHYLPILSAREQVISTLPFTLIDHTPQTLRIDTLWSKSARMADRLLTIEASSNPTWYAVTALPVLADRPCYSSTDWADRLYAVILAKHIAASNPAIAKTYADTAFTAWAGVLSRNEDLKNTLAEESPWLVEGEKEAERAAALATLFDAAQNALKEHTALDNLRKLQNADGSWSWCPGMSGSTYITSRIAVILARLQKLSGYETDMLARAYGFLEKELVEYVKEAKKEKYRGCPYSYLRYLYATSLTGRELTGNALKNSVKYLVQQVEEDVKSTDMHSKALYAIVLARYGKEKVAQTALQSLIEHTTMADPQRGRFFDTRRAPMTWSSYRIPTQTCTMEALTMTAPDVMWSANGSFVGVRDKVLTEMRLWLLQAKRTQMWETSSASIDAIYALLMETDAAGQATGTSELTRETVPVRYTLQNAAGRILTANNRADVKGAETVGYVCDRYADKPQVDARTVSVRGYDNSVAWGSVYARYTLPVEDVVAAGKGLNIDRRLEVRREGKWEALEGNSAALTVGDRIRVVFTLTADRDYDYVSLRTGRPACTEPADKLSGYRWTEAGGCYRVVRDTDLQYFFEKMRKGTHTFTDELLIDRAGTYTFAPSRIQCLYSPEFQGISKSNVLIVTP